MMAGPLSPPVRRPSRLFEHEARFHLVRLGAGMAGVAAFHQHRADLLLEEGDLLGCRILGEILDGRMAFGVAAFFFFAFS